MNQHILRGLRWSVLTLLGTLLGAALPSLGDPETPPTPAPAPTTEPAAAAAPAAAPDPADVARIEKLFTALAASDATKRSAARDELFTLERPDLPALKRVVQKSLPLQPGQRAVLHDVVMQAYLSQEPYDPDPRNLGFLGIRFDPDQISLDGYLDFGLNGFEVRHRIPGFCAYRWLRDGDIIKYVVMDPPKAILTKTDLATTVTQFAPGQVVVFQVLRDGKLLRLAIRLDALPREAQINPDGFREVRRQAADEYWDREFAPLVENDLQ